MYLASTGLVLANNDADLIMGLREGGIDVGKLRPPCDLALKMHFRDRQDG